MSAQLLESIASAFMLPMEQAILETLAYSDVFDYPLRFEELHRYLPLHATASELKASLHSVLASIGYRDGFYFLPGREAIIPLRQKRESISVPALRSARRIGHVLGRLPFIRMVALTGSLALLNSEETADLDYMLVTAPGRVWTARGFALLFGRLTAHRGYTLCPNLIVSEHALEWPQHDIYSAREICQMIPIAGGEVYERVRCINQWTADMLPNASGAPPLTAGILNADRKTRGAVEWPLRGGFGDRLERWEMNRKVRLFTRQEGFGVETRFDANVCQGNFLHHGLHAREALRERLARLSIEPAITVSAREPH